MNPPRGGRNVSSRSALLLLALVLAACALVARARCSRTSEARSDSHASAQSRVRPAPEKPAETPTPAASKAGAPEEAAKPEAKAEAPPKCGDCHTEEVAKFAGNPHARYSHRDKKPDPNSFCETCHGNGAKHMEAGGDKSSHPDVSRSFRRRKLPELPSESGRARVVRDGLPRKLRGGELSLLSLDP